MYTIKIYKIFLIFLVFLPFTQALTLNLGFPLKVSELVLFFLLVIFLVKKNTFKSIQSVSLINQILLFFLIWVSFSFVINMFWNYNYSLKEVPNRISPLFDSFLRLVYIYLAAFTFFISQYFFKRDISVLKYWVNGAVFAAFFGWYLFVFSGFNLPYFKLPGMDENPQSINGFIRCGTFKEGNYFGLFLLLSATIAFYLKKTKSGVFLLVSIITTMSTITLISVGVFAVYVLRKALLKKKLLLVGLMSLPLVIMFSFYFLQTDYFENNVYKKLVKPANELSKNNISKVDRVLTSRIALKQGINNLVFGVGPYNYGLHYDKYNDFETYLKNNNSWSLEFFNRKNKRAIPNNVYMEIWAEYGVFGFFIFVTFLVLILVKSYKSGNDLMTGGMIALLISFNAFPSFIMLFVWVFLAIPISINKKASDVKIH